MASLPDKSDTLPTLSESSSDVVPSTSTSAALLTGVEQWPDGVFLLDRSTAGGRVVYANNALATALGCERAELIGSSLASWFGESFTTLQPELLDAGTIALALERGQFELRLHPVNAPALAPSCVLGVLRDITLETRRAHEELERARLSSVELLAAGLAHEINNPLASITTNLEWLVTMLRGMVPSSTPSSPPGVPPNPNLQSSISAALVDALAGAERIESAIRYLSVLSGIEDSRRELLDVRSLLETAVAEIEDQIGKDIRLLREYGNVPPVMASEQRLKQAFVNLLLNAAQAIGSNTAHGSITMRVHGSSRVRVEIQDSGCGVAAGVHDRLFSPFVTTKPVGLGKGLGLFLCRLIVEAAGGSVGFSSDPSGGATFWVELPGMPDEIQNQ